MAAARHCPEQSAAVQEQGAFFELFGHDTSSVELDALHPNHVRQLVREAIEQHIDEDELKALRLEEAAARESLAAMAEGMNH